MSEPVTPTQNPEPRKNTVPALLLAVMLVAGIAAGGLVMMASNGVAQNDKTNTANAKPAAPGEVKVGNPVVAQIGDEKITRADVMAFIDTLPAQLKQQAPLQDLFPVARDQVINNMIVTKKAKSAGLEEDAEVKKLIADAQSQIIRNVYIERTVNDSVSQKDVLKAYEDFLAKFERVQETKARHILVDTEDKAKEIIGKLQGGAKFEDMVKEYSTGPSKDNGGDLGYFAKQDMLPEFSDAAFALNKGEYSKAPVKTQFGWHVIIADDRRQRPEPKFEDVKAQLEAMVRQKKVGQLLEQWTKEAKVERFDINGDKEKTTKK